MVSKKITDLSHKQEGISSGEEEEEKSGALACRYASTQFPPPITSARGDSKLHRYFQISPLSSEVHHSSRCPTGIKCEMKKMK